MLPFFAVKNRLIIGAPPISSLLTKGVLAFDGKTTAETLSLTSFVASSIVLLKKNLTMTTLIPSLEVEVMLSIPPILDIASSIFSVTCDSIVLDCAPGYTVLIVTIGKSIFGKSADGILLKLIYPKITSVSAYIKVMIGRFIANLYIFCLLDHLFCYYFSKFYHIISFVKLIKSTNIIWNIYEYIWHISCHFGF